MGLSVSIDHFGYSNDNVVLTDISFSVKAGNTLSILGGSGSGKTTLLRLISSLLPAEKSQQYEGQIKFNSESIDLLKETGHLSYMFQEAALLPNLTVKANIELPARIYTRVTSKSVTDTIQIVGLTSSVGKLPRQLSGGMKTRTSLARSFITQPFLLLLDEPFGSLDLGWKHSLYRELNVLQTRDNTAIVMVTHDVEEAIELGDEILILSHSGRSLDSFTVTESNKQEILHKAKDIILQDHISFVNSQ